MIILLGQNKKTKYVIRSIIAMPCSALNLFIWGFKTVSQRAVLWAEETSTYFVKVLYCKLPTISKQLTTFPHKVWGLNCQPQGGKQVCYHCAIMAHVFHYNIYFVNEILSSPYDTKVHGICMTFLNDINSVDVSRRAQLLMQMEEVVQRYKVIYKMCFVKFFVVSRLSDWMLTKRKIQDTYVS